MSFEMGSMVEPLAFAMSGIQVSNLKNGDTILVMGAGTMGILMVQLAKIAGAANIIISEFIAERRKIAEECGATHIINPEKQDMEEEIKKIKYCGADVIIDCSGNTKVALNSLSYCRRGGHVVWYSVYPQSELVPISPFNMNENEIFLSGSFNNPYSQVRALELNFINGKRNRRL